MNIMKRQIVLVNNMEYEVIATYSDEKSNKEFVVFTDNSYTNNNLNVYYGLYDKDTKQIKGIDNPNDEAFIKDEINKLHAIKLLYTMKCKADEKDGIIGIY